MTGALTGPCDAASVGVAEPAPTRHPTATLVATILGSSVALIDGSVMNVALPVLGRDLGASASGLAWTINAYLLPLGALILLGGSAGDHFGRRRLFVAGLCCFALASIVCVLAPDLDTLLAGRALQGLGSALLLPNSLAILGAAFRDEERGRAVGSWAAAGALAGALGPLVGGWLVDTVGWRSIFFLNLPVAAGAVWLGQRFVEESREHGIVAPLDWLGAALSTAVLGLSTWALTAASGRSITTLQCLLAAGAAVLLLVVFLRLERQRGGRAIMPLALFSSRSFVGLTILTFLLYANLGALFVLLPYLLMRAGGATAVAAGAALLPLPLVIGIGSRLTGRLAGRSGARWLLVSGAAIVAFGFALYALDGSLMDGRHLLMPTVVVAMGMGLCVAPLTTSVMASVDADHVGTAAGFNSAVARIGGLVATALLGFVFAIDGPPAALIAAFRIATVCCAASAAVAALSALILIDPVRTPKLT